MNHEENYEYTLNSVSENNLLKVIFTFCNLYFVEKEVCQYKLKSK